MRTERLACGHLVRISIEGLRVNLQRSDKTQDRLRTLPRLSFHPEESEKCYEREQLAVVSCTTATDLIRCPV